MLMVTEESFNSSLSSGFKARPSHLIHPDTVKLPEVCFCRIMSTFVVVMGDGGLKGNWIVYKVHTLYKVYTLHLLNNIVIQVLLVQVNIIRINCFVKSTYEPIFIKKYYYLLSR